MKYMITGGCGFLGSNIASEILKNEEALVIYDNLSRLGSDANLGWLNGQGEFSFVKADVSDFSALSEVVRREQPDVVYHLAGQVAMTTSISNPMLDFETNSQGSLNILEAIRLYSADTIIVFSSTNKVYGDLNHLKYTEKDTRYVCNDYPNGFDESISLDFRSPYGCSKGAADQYFLDYARVYGLKTIVFRHSSMYGSRQYGTFDQGWISWFCQKAVETRNSQDVTFTISGDGKQVRDVLHADDMIRLYLLAPTHIDRAAGQVFNIGGGMDNSLSLLELFKMLEKMLGIELNYTRLPPRESDQKVFVADIGKARSVFCWTPKVCVDDGICMMVEWMLGGEIYENKTD